MRRFLFAGFAALQSEHRFGDCFRPRGPHQAFDHSRLSARNLAEFSSRGLAGAANATDWTSLFGAVVDAIAGFFRSEPGFKSLRFGDVLDVRPRADAATGIGTVAVQVSTLLADQSGLEDAAELRFRVETALELADSLLARAFAFKAEGERKFITEARKVALDYLAGYYSR